MNKSDLKTGMWVENEKEEKGMVIFGTKDGDIISGKNLWSPLSEYDENLKGKNGNTNIVKVYQPTAVCYYFNFDKYNSDLLWERQPEPEYTDFMTAAMSGRQIRYEE